MGYAQPWSGLMGRGEGCRACSFQGPLRPGCQRGLTFLPLLLPLLPVTSHHFQSLDSSPGPPRGTPPAYVPRREVLGLSWCMGEGPRLERESDMLRTTRVAGVAADM